MRGDFIAWICLLFKFLDEGEYYLLDEQPPHEVAVQPPQEEPLSDWRFPLSPRVITAGIESCLTLCFPWQFGHSVGSSLPLIGR